MSAEAEHPRSNIRAPLSLVVVIVDDKAADEQVVEAVTVDLSAGGAGVVCREYFGIGRPVALALTLDDGSIVSLAATVVSRVRTPDRRWRYGVRFADVGDETRARLTRQVLRALASAFAAGQPPAA